MQGYESSDFAGAHLNHPRDVYLVDYELIDDTVLRSIDDLRNFVYAPGLPRAAQELKRAPMLYTVQHRRRAPWRFD